MYDAQANIWFRRRGSSPATGPNSEETPSANTPSADPDQTRTRQDEPLADLFGGPTYGPIGIQRLYANEAFLTAKAVQSMESPLKSGPLGVINGFTSAITSALLRDTGIAGRGLPDMLMAHEAMGMVSGPVQAPGVVLFGLVRFKASEVTEGFATTWATTGQSGTDQSTTVAGLTLSQNRQRLRALNMFMAGDLERVKAELRYDTGFTGDFLRSLLFAGDNYIEAPSIAAILGGGDTFSETYARWFRIAGSTPAAGDAYLRDNLMVSGVKMHGHVLSPYTMQLS